MSEEDESHETAAFQAGVADVVNLAQKKYQHFGEVSDPQGGCAFLTTSLVFT